MSTPRGLSALGGCVSAPGAVCSQGGICSQGVCLLLGVCLLWGGGVCSGGRGCLLRGGVYDPRECMLPEGGCGIPACTEADTTCEQNDRQV